MKLCYTCNTTKNPNEFHVRNASRDGLAHYCKDCSRTYMQKRYAANPQKQLDYRKQWKKNNPEKERITRAQNKSTPYAKKREHYGWAIRRIMLNGSDKYCCPHIGCTGADLRRHIESKFRFGMTWDNYKTLWTLDHIKPVSCWPLEEMRKADHYTNLQPLLKQDNDEKQKATDAVPCSSCSLCYAPRQLENGLCRNCR